jgi:AraC family transcriptional activator of pobA
VSVRGDWVWEESEALFAARGGAGDPQDWPFDAAFPLDVRHLHFRRRPRASLSCHDYCEVLYVNDGEICLEVEKRVVPVRQGDLFVMGTAVFHRISRCLGAPARATVLHFRPELLRNGEAGLEPIDYLTPFLEQDESFPHVIPAGGEVPAQVSELMDRIRGELPAATARQRLAAKTYLKMILVLLGNHYAPYLERRRQDQHRQRDRQRLEPLLRFLEKNYRRRLTVEEAAAMLHMSRSHFMRFFRRATGEPLISYLNRLRISKAEALLASGTRTIAQVSQEVGFCDQSYFGYVFRKMLHMSPRQFKRHRGDAEPRGGGWRGSGMV